MWYYGIYVVYMWYVCGICGIHQACINKNGSPKMVE